MVFFMHVISLVVIQAGKCRGANADHFGAAVINAVGLYG
jgi:hypothetical protein